MTVAGAAWRRLLAAGFRPRLLSLGGGLPVPYRRRVPTARTILAILRRGLAAQVLKSVSDADVDVPLPAVANAALAKRVAEGSKGGYVEAAGRLLLFVRLVSPAWYYVAEFERAPYLSGKLPAGHDALASR